MIRSVTLVHRLGSTKLGLTGELLRAGAGGKSSKVNVAWPLNGTLIFSALTGRESGSPHGPWRLSDDDVAAFCAELGLKPSPPPPVAKKRRPPDRTRIKVDVRQLSLVQK